MNDLNKLRNISIAKILNIPADRNTKIRCPFHNERTPSCMIYKDNSYFCFGCGKHGRGAIDMVVHLGYDIKTAIKELANYL